MASVSATVARKKREQEMSDIMRQDEDEWLSQVVAEGVEAMVPYRGPVHEVLFQLAGGLRSGMSYSNAHNLEQLWQNARFVRITPAGLRKAVRTTSCLTDRIDFPKSTVIMLLTVRAHRVVVSLALTISFDKADV